MPSAATPHERPDVRNRLLAGARLTGPKRFYSLKTLTAVRPALSTKARHCFDPVDFGPVPPWASPDPKSVPAACRLMGTGARNRWQPSVSRFRIRHAPRPPCARTWRPRCLTTTSAICGPLDPADRYRVPIFSQDRPLGKPRPTAPTGGCPTNNGRTGPAMQGLLTAAERYDA